MKIFNFTDAFNALKHLGIIVFYLGAIFLTVLAVTVLCSLLSFTGIVTFWVIAITALFSVIYYAMVSSRLIDKFIDD